ncbi:MAG: uracil-DNA glycosylase [Candidatus Geothermincolia bacterium]
MDLLEMYESMKACDCCPLAAGRTQVVFGSGNPHAEIMFVGEAPGFNEDKQGQPFVGPAGQLLDQLLKSIELKRADVYITNTVKCRPPGNRDPEPAEIAACRQYLTFQVAKIEPRAICTLGNHATKSLLDTRTGITGLHGQRFERDGVVYVPLYHPAAALHNPSLKSVLIEDFERLRAYLEEMRRVQPQPESAQQLGLF